MIVQSAPSLLCQLLCGCCVAVIICDEDDDCYAGDDDADEAAEGKKTKTKFLVWEMTMCWDVTWTCFSIQ